MGKNVVICGFSGVGKSTAEQKAKNVYDYESSAYSHVFGESGKFEKNRSFPLNYIDALCHAMNKSHNCVYLLSCHQEVRDELNNRGIPYIIVLPRRELKNEYIKRWLKRGSSLEFIESMNDRWDEMIDSCEKDTAPKIYLDVWEHIGDVLPM